MDFIRTILGLSRTRVLYVVDPDKRSAFLESVQEIESRYFASFYDFQQEEIELEPDPTDALDELSLSLVPDEGL